ncbi:MAG: site-specific DNA-methyltransferase, partial [Candidatus Gastranaerophilales bacterium]|nr:site-specific DNA-methyltransferase [Candidatus Gastranaerophilales bacterium]
MLIKGNNLLALSSILKRYEGKVKCIYIDPPYNTGSDSFNYNDNFNHSTWLTFMKNRLQIAKNLLKEDGVLFISLDDKEAHYCKVLADEIFKRENFIADICHKARGSISNDKIISSNHNHILFYAKNERFVFSKKHEYGIFKDLSNFTEKDENGYYKLVPVDGPGGAAKGNPYYEFLGLENYWRFSKNTMQAMYKEGLIVKKGNSLQQKYYKTKAENQRQTITTWWDEGYLTSSATSQLKTLMGEDCFKNPKNENLIELILEFATKENDIVLDYHLGSGTTCAVAHK